MQEQLIICALRALSDSEHDSDELQCLAVPCVCAVEQERTEYEQRASYEPLPASPARYSRRGGVQWY